MGGCTCDSCMGRGPDEPPNLCEDCWNIDENDICPVGDISTMKNEDFDKCPVHSMVDKCGNCDKKMGALIGYLPKSFVIGNPWDGSVGCCSEKCAQELKAKYDKEVELEMQSEKENAEAHEKAMENYEGGPEEWEMMYANGIVEKKEYTKMMKKFKKEDRRFKRRLWVRNAKKKLSDKKRHDCKILGKKAVTDPVCKRLCRYHNKDCHYIKNKDK